MFRRQLNCRDMEIPNKWKELEGDAKRLLEANCKRDHVQYENGLVMPRYFAETMAHRVYNFHVREDDIWVVSYPKTGTTLTLEMVWMIVNNMVKFRLEHIIISDTK